MSNFNELEHPRWPAEAPESRGGQFRPTDTDSWVQQVSHAIGQMSFQQLTDLGGRTDYKESYLGGGGQSSTHLRTYSTGERVVHKSISSDGDDEEDYWYDSEDPQDHAGTEGLSPEDRLRQADNEVLASRLGRAIGAPVPAVIHAPGDPGSVLMEYISGQVAWEAAGAGAHQASQRDGRMGELIARYAGTDDGLRLGILDMVLENGDRHGGNWIIGADGRPYGIDHAFILQDNGGDAHAGPFVEALGNGAKMHPLDVDRLEVLLTKLRDQGFVTENDIAFMQFQILQMHRNARGTRRLIR